jgi:DtxR family Mn-dependent transcriptional regulator
MDSAAPFPALTSAMEDYLETIYHLEQERRIARVRDIAGKLGVKMSSVSAALKILGARGLIKYDPHQYITLTDKGITKAKEIVRKHEVLKRFLVRILKIDDSVAEDNACRIEHHLDPEVIEKLVRFVEFMELCPLDQTKWLEGVSDSCEDCIPCLEEARQRMKHRAEAQKTALAEGMTLAEVETGSQVLVDNIKGSARFKKQIAEQGIENGVIVEVEQKKPLSNVIGINIKGYHVSLNAEEAEQILVKPI